MIRFDYRLTGAGWSAATVSDEQSSVNLTASYLEDALGDLLGAVVLLLEGTGSVRCRWQEEPGEFRWVFDRHGDDVHLRILGFPNEYSKKPDSEGCVLFETTQQLGDLAVAAVEAAEEVLAEHGPAGYLEKWGESRIPGRARPHDPCVVGRLT